MATGLVTAVEDVGSGCDLGQLRLEPRGNETQPCAPGRTAESQCPGRARIRDLRDHGEGLATRSAASVSGLSGMARHKLGHCLASEILLVLPIGLDERPLGRSRDQDCASGQRRLDLPYAIPRRGCPKTGRFLICNVGIARKVKITDVHRSAKKWDAHWDANPLPYHDHDHTRVLGPRGPRRDPHSSKGLSFPQYYERLEVGESREDLDDLEEA